jgi:hypothetical protein
VFYQQNGNVNKAHRKIYIKPFLNAGTERFSLQKNPECVGAVPYAGRQREVSPVQLISVKQISQF